MVTIALLSILFVSASCHVYFSPLDYLQFENAAIEIDSSVTVSASPSTLNTSGEWATVTWSGVSKPNSKDWIGVYTPPVNGNTIDPKKQAPVKYQYCKHSSTHLSDGKGSFKFYMVNMRAPYVFGLLRNGFKNPTLVATSNLVQFSNPNEPLQGHLMLTDNILGTELKLMWVTRDIGEPLVKYGPIDGSNVYYANATSTTYNASDMCGSPANDVGFISPGYLHTAILFIVNIPGRKVSYSFGDDKFGWSRTYNFNIPQPPEPTLTTRIIAFGDMGRGQVDDSVSPDGDQQPSLNTTRLIEREMDDASVILHIGDVSYARGYAGLWDEFFDQIQTIATHVPYMVCIGNHERDYPDSGSYYPGTDSGGECGVPYEMRFPMPRPAKNQDWYTFKLGSAQVVLMSTEHNFTRGSLQYQWINDTLSKVNRSQTPWLIFAGHRPLYCDSTYDVKPAGDLPVSQELRKYIEPLLMQYKVDLALWGHHHSYQRTCQVYQEKCTKGAPVNVIIGMAGQGLSQNIRSEQPSWLEKIDIYHYGYTRITTNQTTLVFEYVRDDDGKVHDTLVLKR